MQKEKKKKSSFHLLRREKKSTHTLKRGSSPTALSFILRENDINLN